ncbi:MAG: ATP-binding protein [Thermococcus sp.]|nr:ATP-binding protein [Thermococcus sp.]
MSVIIMVIIIIIIIQRRELDKVLNSKWLLIYGRRKTGKTFYIREKARYNKYFIVTKSKTVIELQSGEELNQEEFRRLLPLLLETEERIIIDEFHRLNEPFFSMLQGMSGQGKITLITSTLHYFRKIVGKNSPLLGLFELKSVSLVDPRDSIIFAQSLGLSGKSLLEVACLVREPWLAPKAERLKEKIIYNLGDELRTYVPYLIGEIFSEEDLEYTPRYAGILEAIANGRCSSSEISSFLFSRGVIEKDNPGLISQYLKNLIQMGVIKAIPLFGKRRKTLHYRHLSPITDFAFYLNAKHAFFEAEMDESKIGRLLKERIPLYMEWFFEDFLVRHFGFQPVKVAKPQLEIDVALVDHKKVKVVAEVKWKDSVKKEEIRKIEEKLHEFENAEKILIVPEREALKIEPEGIKVWDWRTFAKFSKK